MSPSLQCQVHDLARLAHCYFPQRLAWSDTQLELCNYVQNARMRGRVDGRCSQVGEGESTRTQTPVQDHDTLMCRMRIQTQKFAVSKYVLPPHPICEAKGHLMGARVVGGRDMCQQF